MYDSVSSLRPRRKGISSKSGFHGSSSDEQSFTAKNKKYGQNKNKQNKTWKWGNDDDDDDNDDDDDDDEIIIFKKTHKHLPHTTFRSSQRVRIADCPCNPLQSTFKKKKKGKRVRG